MESTVCEHPEVFKVFFFWSGIMALKLLGMIPLTVRQRFRKRVFSNIEDTPLRKDAVVSYEDADVERVRRAHLNDLESVLPWFIATYIWLGTGPPYWLAGILIRSFVISRYLHTFVYAVLPLPQPSRAIVFYVGYAITAFMIFATLLHFYNYV